MADKLEDMYYMSRRSSIQSPAAPPLSTRTITCLCYRIQMGDAKDRVLSEMQEQALARSIDRERLLRFAGGVKESERHGGVPLPLLVGSWFLPRDWVRKTVETASASGPAPAEADRKAAREVEHLYWLYEQLAQTEWGALDDHVRSVFTDEARTRMPGSPGWQYYQYVRQFYFGNGIADPPTFLKSIQEHVTFLGRRVTGGAHRLLATVLGHAEKEIDQLNKKLGKNRQTMLRAWVISQSIASFVPRSTTGKEPHWSNHAAGLAVDIDPDTNPFLRGSQAALLDRLLAWLHVAGLTPRPLSVTKSWLTKNVSRTTVDEAEALFDEATAVSDAVRGFLGTYLEAWLDRTVKQLPAPTTSPDGEAHAFVEQMVAMWGGRGGSRRKPEQWTGYRALARIRDRGLVTIPMALVVALKRAGEKAGTPVTWGVQWEGGKDQMHFEIPLKSVYKRPSPKNPC